MQELKSILPNVSRALFGRSPKAQATRLQIAVATLEQIAHQRRGGLAKRLAVSTLAFITPPAPQRFPRIECPACGQSVSTSKAGAHVRAHRHEGEWCPVNDQYRPPFKSGNKKGRA